MRLSRSGSARSARSAVEEPFEAGWDVATDHQLFENAETGVLAESTRRLGGDHRLDVDVMAALIVTHNCATCGRTLCKEVGAQG